MLWSRNFRLFSLPVLGIWCLLVLVLMLLTPNGSSRLSVMQMVPLSDIRLVLLPKVSNNVMVLTMRIPSVPLLSLLLFAFFCH
jgi:hypothetical protein